MKRLTRLKVDRPVLHLQDDVVAELPIQRHELVGGLFGAVVGLLLRIDERAPHDDAAVGCHGVGDHVGAVGVGSRVVLRPGLPLGVGFHQEAAEIRNEGVDLIGLGTPPGTDTGIQRVGGFQAADLDGRAEAGRQVHAYAVGSEQVSQGRELAQVGAVSG